MASRRVRGNITSYTAMNGILPLCLVASTGVAITFVSLLPLAPDTPPFNREVLYITGKLSLSTFVLIIIVQLFSFIRNKRKHHENQTVFWPMRCRYCAITLGLANQESPSTSSHSRGINPVKFVVYENPAYHSPRHRVRSQDDITSPTQDFTCRSPLLTDGSVSPAFSSDHNPQVCSTTLMDYRPEPGEDGRISKCSRNGYVYRNRNRSFLKIYGVLLIFALVSIPVTLVDSIMCVFKGENYSKISMISSSIQSTVLLALIPVSMQFAVNYYDAAFATTRDNVMTMVLFMSGAIWISIFKIATPVSELLNSPYSQPGGPCKLKGAIAKVQQISSLLLTPFNAECAIIALCILRHMWASFVRVDSIRPETTHLTSCDIFQEDGFLSCIKRYLRRCRVFMVRRRRDYRQSFLHPSVLNLQNCLSRAWGLSLLISLVYFIATMYITIDHPFKSHFHYELEVMWSTDIVYILPFFILHMHQLYVSRNSQETFATKSPRKVEDHDVLLLLCSCGIFCQCIMRLAAGSGLLLSDVQAPQQSQYKALSVYAVLYSFAIIIMIWKMTAFLLQVQGIHMTNICEIKYVLICLIYISVMNGTRWLVESIIVNRWHLQCAFYGKNAGSAVGILLEPFATLYGLHAATVAYEAYKSILQESRDQYTSVERVELYGDQ